MTRKQSEAKRRMTKKQREAKAFLDANWSLIILHTLYLRWGLPTSLLKKP